LWLNLVTDGAPALALGTEKGDPDIMDQAPRPKKEPIVNRFMLFGIGIQTIAIAGATLLAYSLGLRSGDQPTAETMAFVTLSLSELLRAYTARSERYPLLKMGVFKNKWMNYAVLASVALVMAVIYLPFLNGIFDTVPLTMEEWEEIIPLLLLPSVAAELVKYIVSGKKKKTT
jgi:Ca2+-transporting ATPase